MQPAASATTCYEWDYDGAEYLNNPSGLQAAIVAGCQAEWGGEGYTCADGANTCSGTPTSSTQTCEVCSALTLSNGANVGGCETMTAVSVTCPTSACTAMAGTDSFVGGFASPGLGCDNGCEINAAQPTMSISGTGANSSTTYSAPYTGNTCSSGEAQVSSGQCSSAGGQTTCLEQGANCGTVNGDQVCPQSIPPGTCVSYASGGIACVSSSSGPPASPPGPNDGTAGVAATPSADVTSGSGATSSTAYYYSSSTVADSSSATQAAPTGTNTGNGGSAPSGTGSSGPVSIEPNAGNGDCGAASNSAPCAAAASGAGLPSTQTDLTYAGIVQTFESAVQGSAVMSGVSAIESSWPSGACDLGTVALATLPGTTLDYTTPFCTFWSAHVVGSLSALMLAAWAVLGVLLILTA